jgi:hypothetical protein
MGWEETDLSSPHGLYKGQSSKPRVSGLSLLQNNNNSAKHPQNNKLQRTKRGMISVDATLRIETLRDLDCDRR